LSNWQEEQGKERTEAAILPRTSCGVLVFRRDELVCERKKATFAVAEYRYLEERWGKNYF
jgi:hypothetical protein